MVGPLSSANYEANFQALVKVLLSWSDKAPEKSEPLLRALKEMYFYTNTLQIEIREVKLEAAKERSEKNKEITKLREQVKSLEQNYGTN